MRWMKNFLPLESIKI